MENSFVPVADQRMAFVSPETCWPFLPYSVPSTYAETRGAVRVSHQNLYPAGGVVADICAGSGTTAVAAVNTGRRFVCFETAPAFYAPATERIRLATGAVKAGQKGV